MDAKKLQQIVEQQTIVINELVGYIGNFVSTQDQESLEAEMAELHGLMEEWTKWRIVRPS